MSNILKHVIRRALQEQLVMNEPEPEVAKSAPKKPAPKKKPAVKTATPAPAPKKPAAPTAKEKERKETIDKIYDEIGDDSSGSGTTTMIVGLVAAATVLGGGLLLKGYLARKGVRGLGSLYKVLGKNVDKLKKITPTELNRFERFIDAELDAGNISRAEHAELKKIVRAEVLASFRNKMVAETFFSDFSAGRMSYDDFIAGSPEMFRNNRAYRDAARNYYDEVVVPFYGEVASTRSTATPSIIAREIKTGVVTEIPTASPNWTQIRGTGWNDAGIALEYKNAGISRDKLIDDPLDIINRLNEPAGHYNGIYIPTEYLENGLPGFILFRADLVRLGGDKNLSEKTLRQLYQRYDMLLQIIK
jgi:hypothetical protein